MKNFIDCVQKMSRESFDAVIARLMRQKSACALCATEFATDAVDFIGELRSKGLNVTALISIDSVQSYEVSGTQIVNIKNFTSLNPQPTVVFVRDDPEYKIAASQLGKRIEVINWGKNIQRTRAVYEIYMDHISELYDVYTSLIDEESKRVLRGYLLAKVSSKLSYAVIASTPQYICTGFIPEVGDILIDGGACDGLTSKRFSELGCKVFAFEMDKRNYDMANALAKKNEGGGDRFIVENLGLGAYNHEARYTHIEENIGASKISADGNETAQVVTLDYYVASHNLPRVDFIKLDTEGAELDILRGAANSIARWKPKMAISAYHKPDDLWTLMKFIKSIRPDYEFALRQWASTNEDGPYFVTTEMMNLFASFGLDTKRPTFCDCVLMCR